MKLYCPENCPFVCHGERNPVRPDGEPGGLLIIGEAPGYDEVKKGHGFAGIAGKNLKKAFMDLGWLLFKSLNTGKDELKLLNEDNIRRVPVARTNTVLCHPVTAYKENGKPKNRKPTATELKACSQNFNNSIEHYQPKVIIAVGQSAFNALGLFVSPYHGFIDFCHRCIGIQKYNDIPVIPIPHTSPLCWFRQTNGVKHSDIGIANIKKAIEVLNK